MDYLLIDTSVWFAYASKQDENHRKAVRLIEAPGPPLLTIWPGVWETLNLLVFRGLPRLSVELGRAFLAGQLGAVMDVTPDDARSALALMQRFATHRISVVDALCCAVARRLDIRRVASFDRHFKFILTEREVLGPD